MTNFKQDAPMDVYPIRMTAAHARRARKIGQGNLSKGVRKSIEDEPEQSQSDLRQTDTQRRSDTDV